MGAKKSIDQDRELFIESIEGVWDGGEQLSLLGA